MDESEKTSANDWCMQHDLDPKPFVGLMFLCSQPQAQRASWDFVTESLQLIMPEMKIGALKSCLISMITTTIFYLVIEAALSPHLRVGI